MICDELLNLIYGNIVNEVIRNSEHISEANLRLEKIGQKIGIKLVDQFMRDSSQKPCTKLKQMVEKVCLVGVKRFLNPQDCKYEEFKQRDGGCEFNLRIVDNPLLNFVQVPSGFKNENLQYQGIIKGCIKGAFEVLKFKSNTTLIYENIKGEKNESIIFVELTPQIQKL